MPSRRVHVTVGVALGAGAATYLARNEAPGAAFSEILGGALGGYAGARMPDMIDPPVNPRHRSVGHGVIPVGTAGALAVRSMTDLQARLRAEADRRTDLARESSSAARALWEWLLSFLCRLGAGAAAGFTAGYASHIAMDALTPASLPLLA